LGIGDWAQSPIPNPQSPIPNPQSPFNIIYTKFKFTKRIKNKIIKILNKNYIEFIFKHMKKIEKINLNGNYRK
jgi:hypothetical protein